MAKDWGWACAVGVTMLFLRGVGLVVLGGSGGKEGKERKGGEVR